VLSKVLVDTVDEWREESLVGFEGYRHRRASDEAVPKHVLKFDGLASELYDSYCVRYRVNGYFTCMHQPIISQPHAPRVLSPLRLLQQKKTSVLPCCECFKVRCIVRVVVAIYT
jgi:hypothetical protein